MGIIFLWISLGFLFMIIYVVLYTGTIFSVPACLLDIKRTIFKNSPWGMPQTLLGGSVHDFRKLLKVCNPKIEST